MSHNVRSWTLRGFSELAVYPVGFIKNFVHSDERTKLGVTISVEISIPIFTGRFFVSSISFCQICIGSLLFTKALHFVNTNFFPFLITLLTAVLSSFLCKARDIRYMTWAPLVICKT